MKKNFLFLSALLALSLTVLGQSQRFVLFEEFTSASCSWCAYYNPGFNTLLNNNADKCTSIKYQSNFGYDPMYNDNKPDANARTSYYSVPGFPDAVMDGNVFHGSPGSVTQNMITTQSAVPSPFEITINQQLSPGNDSIYVTMLGKATAEVSGALVAHCVVIEKHIHFNSAPGTNGEKDFYNVMKKMLPSSGGTNLPTSFEVGDYFVLQFAWKLANVYSLNELSVVGFIQDAQTKTIFQAANTSATPITGPYQNDLTVLNPGNMEALVCNPVLEPTFDLQNNGTSPLTSAEIKYTINDGPESTYQWTGNLDFLQRAHISLPGKEFTVLPSNVLKIYGDLTNGAADDYVKNDTLKYTFGIAPMPGSQVTVFIKTDNNPEETTWNIKDINGNLLASGGPYTEHLHSYSIPVDLGFGTCYVFSIFDAGGNGLCCDNGIGFYKVYNGSVTVSQANSFGSSVVNQFYSQSAVNVGETPDAASFSVYPNPAWQKSTISFTNAVKEQVTVQVYNMQGAAVINLPTREYTGGQHEINLDCSRLDPGVYTIRLIAGSKAFNQKLTVNK